MVTKQAFLLTTRSAAACAAACLFFCPLQTASAENPVAATTPAATQLQKLSLAEALNLSRERNKELVAAMENASISRARRSGALAGFLPTLSAELSAGTKRDRDPSLDSPNPEIARDYNQYAGGLVLRQSLFNGFSDFANYQALKVGVEVQDLELATKQQEIRKKVIEGYFGIQLLLAKIDAEEEVRKVREQQLEYAQARFRSGTVTEVDVLRARYELESQKPVIAQLRSDLEKEKLAFAHLIGLPLSQAFELTVSLEDAHTLLLKSTTPSLPDALAMAMESNAKIRTLRAKNNEYEHQTAKTRGKHLPKVDLVLRAETRANLREDIGTPDSQRYSGMVEVNIPIFTGLSGLAERSEAAAKMAALDAEFEVAKEELLRDLNTVIRDITLSRMRAVSGESNVKLARRTVDQASAQYRAGTTTLTTVSDTYAELLKARNEHSQALFDGIQAVTTIQTLIGARENQPVQLAPTDAK